ncbi:enoyl-CoA hydratase/carnithine racemase [Pseudacidovorax sp. 1753]|uniref:enoyl-CoA hydratase/isomerase family protein n=1 Tax=Pseudacidovorax sp. 1753 TaxID=3156419 RepID=UPI0033940402
MSHTAPLVLRADAGGVCTLTLNRPDKRNAVNPPLFEALRAHLDDLVAHGGELGVVVLRGAGPCFCAGHDLGEIGAMDLAWLRHESRTLEMFSQLPQIVIAAVHGACVTGGLELALAADWIVAAESARFADTHGRYGLVPMWGMSQRLPRRVGTARALELMATARRVDGREAERIGLANTCFADVDFEAGVAELARAVLANSLHSNATNKRLVHDTDGFSLAQGMAHEQFRSPGSRKRQPPPAA